MVKVFPVEEAATLAGETVSVPEPSAAFTVTAGEAPMAVSAEEEAPVEAATVVRVFAPVAEGALTPEPPPDLSPKVMVRAEPPERVTAETRMHLLEEEQAPVEVSIETVFEPVPPEALVYPAALEVVLGWVKPEGTCTRTEPAERPPVAAV